MKRVMMAAGVGAGVAVARRLLSSSASRDHDRWLAVTVNCGPDQLMPGGQVPEPLRRLGTSVEVQVRPAADDKGTELLARPVAPAGGPAARVAGNDPRQPVRQALREAKSLVETGEVLKPARPGSDHPTVRGKLMDLVISRSRGEGRL